VRGESASGGQLQRQNKYKDTKTITRDKDRSRTNNKEETMCLIKGTEVNQRKKKNMLVITS
jgi:hypothetical protein